ncbi:hypothetical protein KSC_019120 [Ktedonobacter sp. SOSP1-52]|nr:hypothetical protein KSC_019120 [Ktedonobacter sp. SOSP1-52]
MAEADGCSGPRFNKVWEALGKHFPFTVQVATGELAHSEEQLDPLARAGHIT